MDLIFPHHESEIAQSESLGSKPFARHWIHVAPLFYHEFPLPSGPSGISRRIVFTNPSLTNGVSLRNESIFGRDNGLELLGLSLAVDPAHYIYNQLCLILPSRRRDTGLEAFAVAEFFQGGGCRAHEHPASSDNTFPIGSARRKGWLESCLCSPAPDGK